MFMWNIKGHCHFTTTRAMLASEFIDRLNEFIATRSIQKGMISDNAQTFKVTAEFTFRATAEFTLGKVKSCMNT